MIFRTVTNYICGDPGDPTRDVAENRDSIDKGIVRAYIGDSVGGDTTDVNSSGGSVSVTADSDATIVNVTIGAAGADTVAIAGSISINFMKNIVDASIQGGADVTANNNVTVSADVTPLMIIVAGAASGASTSAGSIASATNDMRNAISAGIEGTGTTVTATTGDVTVEADVSNTGNVPAISLSDGDVSIDAQIWSFVVSGAGAGTFGGAGALALNWIRNTVDAHVSNNAAVTASSGTVTVSAEDNATLNVLAGSGAGSSTAAVGAAVAFNYGGGDPDNPNSSDTNLITAYIDAATVNAGSIVVEAKSNATINAFALSISGSGSFAGAGSLSLNFIKKTIDAHIVDTTGVTATGDISITAEDDSTINSFAAQISGAGTVAVGAVVAYNEIDNTIEAYIKNSTVVVTPSNSGDIKIEATSDATIFVVAAGLSGSGSASVAGTGGGNVIDNTVSAYIDGGTVTTDDNIVLLAESDDFITAFGGTLSGSAAVGVAGTVVVNKITNTTEAYISDSSVNSSSNRGKQVKVRAHSKTKTESFGGTLTFGGTGVGAGVTFNTDHFDNTTKAFIEDPDSSSDLDAIYGTDIEVSALAREQAETDAIGLGAAALAGTGSGARFQSVSNTEAYVSRATLNASGSISIDADTRTFASYFVGAAAGGVGGARRFGCRRLFRRNNQGLRRGSGPDVRFRHAGRCRE